MTSYQPLLRTRICTLPLHRWSRNDVRERPLRSIPLIMLQSMLPSRCENLWFLLPTLENVDVYSKIMSGFLAQRNLILMLYLKMFRTKASPDPQSLFSYPFALLHLTGSEPSHLIPHLQISKSKTNLDFCRNTVYPPAPLTNW